MWEKEIKAGAEYARYYPPVLEIYGS